MVSCWAEALTGCCGGQSREHYLSRSIIGSDDVRVSGFPFLRGETRLIPGERLVAKILCKHHNTILSPVDAAAGHFFQVLKGFKSRAIMRARGARKPGGIDMYRVNGPLVERWFLKTVINVMFDREINTDRRWRPSDVWVRSAFGVAPFPEGCGFYFLEGESNWRDSSESAIGIRPLTHGTTDSIIGGQFIIEDLQFAVSMERPHESHGCGYRIRAIKDKPSLNLRQIINFDWSP
jgi:hypothetical protein